MTFSQYLRLIDIQARMLLKADASKFKLGYLWWFLEPLTWVGVFFVVFNLILDAGQRSGSDFLAFLACGKFAFIWFSKTVVQASNSIVANRALVGKINVPKTLFPIAVVQESLYRQASVYALLLVIVAAFGYPVELTWMWLLPIALVYYLMILACSLVGSYLVCMVRDFGKFIPLVMTFLLFTSGIFWDVRALARPEKTELVMLLNPLAFVLDAHRQVLLYQTSPDVLHLFTIGVLSAFAILATATFMRLKSQYLALKVLS
jgi:lipopolysaccharide transport system permease protein